MALNADKRAISVEHDEVQADCFQTHVEELRWMQTHPPRRSLFLHVAQSVLGSDLYSLIAGTTTQLAQLVFFLLSNPTYALAEPVSFVYGSLTYALLFFGLAIFAGGAFVVQKLGLRGRLIAPFCVKYGANLSFVNSTCPEIFGLSRVGASEEQQEENVARAREILRRGSEKLSLEPVRHCHLSTEPVEETLPASPEEEQDPQHWIGSTRLVTFDLDIARLLIMFAALVYERDSDLVVAAAKLPPSVTENLFLESERRIVETVLRLEGVRYVTVSDLADQGGPFAAAFYPDLDKESNDSDRAPWIVLTFKGTDPKQFQEWQTDATLAHVDASDNFFSGSACHKGFYETLFPSVGSGLAREPHRNIFHAVEAIAADLFDKTGQKAQMYVTGHSLGSGLASLFFTYSLISAKHGQISPHFVLRDGYMFGSPSVGNSGFVAGYERIWSRDEATSTLFRIRNEHDVVAMVPPGFADRRENRISLSRGLLDYGRIGIEVCLKPRSRAPFVRVTPQSLPPGTQVAITDGDDEPVSSLADPVEQVFDPLALYDRIGSVVAPCIAAHAPGHYFRSLLHVQGRSSLSQARAHEDHFVFLTSEQVYRTHSDQDVTILEIQHQFK